jgi:small neutral amino acid transporter SnatA (MarC family)
MIGAGTITQSILIGEHTSLSLTLLILLLGVAIAFAVLVVFKLATDHLKKRREDICYHYMDILARLNGLIIGAVSVQMIVFGLHALWTFRGAPAALIGAHCF